MHSDKLKSLRDKLDHLQQLTGDDVTFVKGRWLQQSTIVIREVLLELIDEIEDLELRLT